MKTLAKISLSIFFGAALNANAMGDDGWASIFESIAAFESRADGNQFDANGKLIYNRPGYVKPIIDNLGNVLNSNWYVSASVPSSIAFEVGLPIALISTSDSRTFTEYGIEQPTIFGDHADLSRDPNIIANDPTVYGNEKLNGLSIFTFPYMQLGFSMLHARAALRFMFLPSIDELQKFNLFGFGLQYSFGHFFQYMLPAAARPLDVSLVFGYNTSGIGYTPKEYKGELDLDISAYTFDMVIGYKPFSFFEVLMTLGYQYSNMSASGTLTCETTDAVGQPMGYYGQSLNPNISVKGNNGFKFGLEVAFQIGASFHPVVGFDYSGKSSFTTNILYFKQQFGEDKTPDEIAKEKGYSRNENTEGTESSKTSDGADETSTQEKDESTTSENVSDEVQPDETDSSISEDSSTDESSDDSSEDSEDF